MAKPKKHGVLSIRSTISAPTSSDYPPAPSLGVPRDDEPAVQPFQFLALPSELRNKIYGLVFSVAPAIMDLDSSTFSLLNRAQILAILRVSRQIYLEATHNFFSTHTFRLFSTSPGRYFKTKRPLLARLPASYRASITSLQLRLGPGWTGPPEGWAVTDSLGLADCTSVKVLKVFVECDPSDVIYKGFRAADGFYERFSANLLEGVLKGVPAIELVEFDGYSYVKTTGDMMCGLRRVVTKYDKVVAWGPESGWKSVADADHIWSDDYPLRTGKRPYTSVTNYQ